MTETSAAKATHKRQVNLKKRRPSGALSFLPFVGPHDRHLSRNAASSSQEAGVPESAVSAALDKSEHQESFTSFSEETVFDLKSQHFVSAAATAEDSYNCALRRALQAVIVTSVASGVGEFFFARPSTVVNPFSTKSLLTSSSLAATASHGQELVVLSKDSTSRPVFFSVLGQSRSPVSQISLAASTTSLLFGTKVYLDHQQQVPTLFSSIIAGAASGTILGVASLFSPQPAVSSFSSTIARHAIAATCYFGAYDFAISLAPSTTSDGKHSTASIMTCGALAGCVHSTVHMVASSSTGIVEQSMLVRWMATSLRAAPTHALVFWGYESLRKNIQ